MKKHLLIAIFTTFFLSGCLPSIAMPGGGKEIGVGEFSKEQIVKGFPSMPQYPKAKVLDSVNDNGVFGASFYTGDELAKVIQFYNESLPALGWESQLVQNSETNYFLNIKNADHEGIVIINTASDSTSTAITVSVEPR